ncbi:hypothetical protein FOS14_12300 [Skermania sp. ID1734]|uniref:hypothetical protein n=1 Tax=Skermania sp. ID1734 TaxID=2597516 RepID=UPI00117BFE59|nr:hypothetical protein [Skermania sp. ID1734]TSD99545.1 hypothetical protein FOS14_12300 [Skermania sp. ID1734]
MTGPTGRPEDTGQISVAELLARNGQNVGSGGRRRRGGKGGISVAELTGDIPVIRDGASHSRLLARPDAPVQKPPIPVTQTPPSPPQYQPVTTAAAWSQTNPEPALLSGNSVAGELLRNRRAEAQRQQDQPPAPAAAAETGADTADDRRSALRQWAVLAGQVVIAVVAGALLFKGFEMLWDSMPIYALILALVVILALVALVRILRKTDDIFSIVIAIVVGVFVTMGPLAFLLSTS